MRTRTHYLFLLSLLVFTGPAIGQITGSVSEKDSGEGIPGANVYYKGTTVGTYTDGKGLFQLQKPPVGVSTLVISHIGFEPLSIPISDIKQPADFKLSPLVYKLAETTVESNRDRPWERNLRKFSRALFGVSKNSKNAEIKNPWVLDFAKGGGALMAKAHDPLVINNYSLGYRIHYQLDHFKLGMYTLELGGSSIFVEMDSTELVEELWIANREELFYGSRQHFFHSLVQGRLAEEKYDVFEMRDTGEKLVTARKLQEIDLVQPLENGNFRIKSKSVLRIKYKGANSPVAYLNDPMFSLHNNSSGSFTPQRDHPGTRNTSGGLSGGSGQESLLLFKRGFIDLSPEGRLLNDLYIDEFGYWAWLRLPDWLPPEYVPREFKVIQLGGYVGAKTMNGFILDNLLIPTEEIVSGGVPKDGIQALIDPEFTSIAEADYLEDDEMVIGVETEGTWKAYPFKILNYHEIINDREIVVTYCPLCASAIVFMSKGRRFGVSGLLYNSDVLMYDYKTQSLWSQLMHKAVSGSLSGTEMEAKPSEILNWSSWKARHPNSQVLSIDTGYNRDYHKNPYATYEASPNTMFAIPNLSSLLESKEKVIGVVLEGISRAYPLAIVKKKGEVRDKIGSKSIVIRYIKEGDQYEIVSEEGERIFSTISYWFAWYAFNPQTEVYK